MSQTTKVMIGLLLVLLLVGAIYLAMSSTSSNTGSLYTNPLNTTTKTSPSAAATSTYEEAPGPNATTSPAATTAPAATATPGDTQ